MDLNEIELRTLIASGEGRTVEFKQGLPRDEKTARTLCAFANTRGGYLFIGVSDKGGPYGAPHPKDTRAELRRIARDLIVPPLKIETTTAPYADKIVVVAQVASSPTKPHSVLREGDSPETVVRVGASNRVATGATLNALGIGHRPKRPTNPIERRIVDWMANKGESARLPGGDVTLPALCKALNIGGQRAKRAFVNLERDGYVVAHGVGKARIFTLS